MKDNLFSYCLILLILCSCGGERNDNLLFSSSFNLDSSGEINLNYLSGERIFYGQDIISAKKIMLHDQSLYVQTKKKDGYIKKFKINGEFLESYFHMGSGPGEVLNLSNFGFGNDQDNSYFYGNDMIQNKMVYFCEEDSLDIQFSKLLFYAFPVNEKEILGVPVESDKMFAYYNFSGEQTKSFGDYPTSDVTDMYYILSQAFVGSYDYNKEKNVFVAALLYTDHLKIFSEISYDEKYIEVRGPLFYEPIFTVTSLHGNPMFTQDKKGRISYVDVIATENEIIGLFSGYSREEKAGKPVFGDKIFIFDYTGKIIKGFEIAEQLISITYDEVNKVLYGLDVISSNEEMIFKYILD